MTTTNGTVEIIAGTDDAWHTNDRTARLERALADATTEADKHRAEIKKLRDQVTKLSHDVYQLNQSRDRWRKVATSMASAINHITGAE